VIVIDTNVLVYAADADSPHHAVCRDWLERQRGRADAWYTTWPILYEFLRVTTHPRVMRRPWGAPEAWDFVAALLASPGAPTTIVSPLIATQCLNNWSLPTRYVEFATPVAEVRIDLWVSFETRVCVAPGEVTDAGPRFGCGATQWQNLVVQPNDELEYYFPLATACPVALIRLFSQNSAYTSVDFIAGRADDSFALTR